MSAATSSGTSAAEDSSSGPYGAVCAGEICGLVRKTTASPATTATARIVRMTVFFLTCMIDLTLSLSAHSPKARNPPAKALRLRSAMFTRL